MASLFITFPNQLASPNHSACLFNTRTCRCSWMAMPQTGEELVRSISGVAGACMMEDQALACCTQGTNFYLMLLQLPGGKPLHAHQLQRVRDPHSVIFSQGHLFLVSTGTNEIYKVNIYEKDLITEELFWQYPGVSHETDAVHLNGLVPFQDTFIATCFGPKTDDLGQRNGRVFFLDTGESIAEGLNQPHTPFCVDEGLFVADSGNGQILFFAHTGGRQFELNSVISTGGYPRGISSDSEHLFIGVSSTRNISKSQKRMLGKQDFSNISSVLALNRRTLRIEDTFDFQPYAREIYDIVPIPLNLDLQAPAVAMGSRILEMEQKTESFYEEIVSSQRRIAELDQEIVILRQVIQELKSTLSWRITVPLRWLYDKVVKSTGA